MGEGLFYNKTLYIYIRYTLYIIYMYNKNET